MEVSGQLHSLAALPWYNFLRYHWIGNLEGSKFGLDTVEKKKLLSLPGIEP
jgi:hypothetical protein